MALNQEVKKETPTGLPAGAVQIDYGPRFESLEKKFAELSAEVLKAKPIISESKTKTRLEVIKESYDMFKHSPQAKMTVKELLSTDAGIALPTMVQARAILELKNWIDAREYADVQEIPKGAGKQVTIQKLLQPDYDDWTEGAALQAADPGLSAFTAVVKPFGKVTQVSDLLANTSAINFVEELGRVHGACVGQGILTKAVTELVKATTNPVGVSSQGYTFADINSGIGKILSHRWKPDFMFTAPGLFQTAATTSYEVTQFYGAMNPLLEGGQFNKILGLDVAVDPYFELASKPSGFSGGSGEVYGIIGTSGVSFGWGEIQPEPTVELYRVPTTLGIYVVTHLDGGACICADSSIALIKHN